MANESSRSSRRVVVWTDGSAESAGAAGWAARHAVSLAWPMHVLHVPRAAALVGADGPQSAGGVGFAERDRAAVDVVRLAQDMRRIRSRHRGLPVTVQVVTDRAHPDRALLHPGDVLDAFATAKDLGTTLDVVRLAPQDGALGDDYWIDPGRSAYLAESRLQADLAKLRTRFPAVPGSSSTLRTRPWATLRTMARAAHLLVLGGSEAGSNLRAVLELDACPIAVVPEA